MDRDGLESWPDSEYNAETVVSESTRLNFVRCVVIPVRIINPGLLVGPVQDALLQSAPSENLASNCAGTHILRSEQKLEVRQGTVGLPYPVQKRQ